MTTVRCKFTCDSKSETVDGITVCFTPVTSGSSENKEFFKYTPWGELKIGTLNKDAAARFEVGKEYFLDLLPATA
ncbi:MULTISPECIES: hypothetical protein [unclassified Thalassospira]|jgi:hypothetical protein|uniref:hypothetical protein n=1 Tax=unclassified Thalassospira TaxID=2648997 RepID=UPI001B2F414E|nr:hypothetical protein [Thalassospira sp.]MBO6771734.1 hypothetical protein [Thalassospira sp.]